MRLRIDYNNMMKKYVGEYGISDAELSALSGKSVQAPQSYGGKTSKRKKWTGETCLIIRKRSLRK